MIKKQRKEKKVKREVRLVDKVSDSNSLVSERKSLTGASSSLRLRKDALLPCTCHSKESTKTKNRSSIEQEKLQSFSSEGFFALAGDFRSEATEP